MTTGPTATHATWTVQENKTKVGDPSPLKSRELDSLKTYPSCLCHFDQVRLKEMKNFQFKQPGMLHCHLQKYSSSADAVEPIKGCGNPYGGIKRYLNTFVNYSSDATVQASTCVFLFAGPAVDLRRRLPILLADNTWPSGSIGMSLLLILKFNISKA